jgi:hypothetical protein
MPCTSNEANVLLALKALQNNKNLSLRAVAKIYNIDRITLSRRRDGKPTRRDSLVNSKKLTKLEEEAIVQYILKLDTRSFLPRLYGIEDIANQLLRVRDAPPIGKL